MEDNYNKDEKSTGQDWNTPENDPTKNIASTPPTNPVSQKQDNKKVLAGILAIIFGSLGIHKFILGYNQEGIILLAISLIGYATSCLGVGLIILTVTSVIGLVEGIIYLTKSDDEFYQTYQVGKKTWF